MVLNLFLIVVLIAKKEINGFVLPSSSFVERTKGIRGMIPLGEQGVELVRSANHFLPPVSPSIVSPEYTTLLLSAEEAVKKDGVFDMAVSAIEQSIIGIHDLLGAGSYGVAIIIFTLLIKLVTFPLNKAQIESTTKMQALQPAVKRIQATYANDPQQMNIMMAELYTENNLNPLAGCLPALVQIPIFIALYRSLLNLAKGDVLEESFLWLPNLEGPVFGAQNADWLLKFDDWNGFSPPLGWHDTLAYLSLPVILIVAQSFSSKLLQPPADPNNPNDPNNNPVLKFLPFMVGFFSLNVPCSLCLYWVVNNVVTTATTLFIKQSITSTTNGNAVTMGGAPVAEPKPQSPPRPQQNPSSFNDLLQANSKSSSRNTIIDTTQDVVIETDSIDSTTEDNELSSQPASKAAEKKSKKRNLDELKNLGVKHNNY